MNREPYGKKCKCGHFESEHVAQKSTTQSPKIQQDLGFLLPHPQAFAEIIRTNCKGCNCKIFEPEKKGWRF